MTGQVGSDIATTEEIQADLNAFLAEGWGPVPRAARIWMGLSYATGTSLLRISSPKATIPPDLSMRASDF